MNDRQIAALKPRDTRYEKSIGDPRGLIVVVPDEGEPDDVLFHGRADSANKALNGVIAAMNELAEMEGKTVEHFSPHDLRKTMVTWMRNPARGIDRDTVSRCQSHILGGVTEKNYVFDEYLDAKKEAWKAWGDYLDTLKAK